MNTLEVGSVVQYQYNWILVTLSFTISVLGSYVALTMASTPGARDKVMGPAVALGGCAIWAMHFIGMAAYDTPLYITYAVLPTLGSLVLAVLITGLGFRIVAKGPRHAPNLLRGGVVVGMGVVVMHYMGMTGMTLRAMMEWDGQIVLISVVIAVVAATVALWLAFNVRSATQRFGAALLMGTAVCAMHYTGMAAATLICTTSVQRSTFILGGPYLAYLVFFVALLTLCYGMIQNKLEAAVRGGV
jgi:NO-binding membrane sensor protein with MHYT domain